MDEFFEDIKFLASFTGHNIFEITEPKQEHLFYTKSEIWDAKGFYSSSGFTVLKGSIIAEDTASYLNWSEKRKDLIEQYTTRKDGQLVMKLDKTFASPSTAAVFCIGHNINGWTVWKDQDGQTLDSVYRKQLE